MQNQPMKRWMTFIDGENLTIRAQNLVAELNITMNPGEQARFWKQDTFIWLPGTLGTQGLVQGGQTVLEWSAARAYYYTSLVGAEDDLELVRKQLWELGFTPRVFKRQKGREKSKGVDITLTKDMLSHAFQNHYDVAVLVAGDGDYVPLVEELKHTGKRVLLRFFSETGGLSPALKLAADEYFDITDMFISRWKAPV